MFHYRLVPSNNRYRMLIAISLAIVLHMALMNFEFTPKPLSVPSVSLPHSVSIVLQRSSITQAPDQPVNSNQNGSHVKEEKLSAEKVPEKHVRQKSPAVIDKHESFLPTPVPSEEPVKHPAEIAEEKKETASEEVPTPLQQVELPAEDLNPQTGENLWIKELSAQTGPQAAQSEEGVIKPGSLQMAYPRYQVNAPPPYPGLARKRGQEGTVILQVLVNREGRVDDLKIGVSSRFPLLDHAAVSAVRKWSFEPGKKGQETISMWVRVPVTFKLKH